jgi:hypothetical protein
MNITGSGLEILRGSTVFEQIDLRVDNWNWRLSRLEGGEKISDQVVIPILMSTGIKHIMGMPKPWAKARSNYLQNFAAQYNQFLGIRATPCNTCGGPCRRDEASYCPWFGLYSGEYVQKYTCEKCLRYICDRGECSLKKCYGCDRKLCKDCKCCQICHRCSDCKSTLQTCVGDGCDRLICNGCITRLGARDALISKGVVKTQKLKKLTGVKKHGARVVRQYSVATIVVAVMNALLPRLNLALWVTVKVRVISTKNVSKHVESAKRKVV